MSVHADDPIEFPETSISTLASGSDKSAILTVEDPGCRSNVSVETTSAIPRQVAPRSQPDSFRLHPL